MTRHLTNKQIVVGVTGGIAAYKAAILVRQLQTLGATVQVVMTRSATEFITPLTFQALTSWPVYVDGLISQADNAMDHIALAKWADCVVIAPATANSLANLAVGQTKGILSTLCLATKATLAVAPAMNQQMWRQPSTQANIKTLRERGILILGPDEGLQACGDIGAGRMLEPEAIAQGIVALFHTGLLAGKKIVITAGPTRESIDPMRYLSNRSTGKMGYALAEAAAEMGAEVHLISGPVALEPPDRVKISFVETAEQMLAEALLRAKDSDWFIATAAVADYRPVNISKQKIKKKAAVLDLALELNPDILATVAQAQNRPGLVVGFAAETHNLEVHAVKKLKQKNLDIIVANTIGQGVGVEMDDNAVTVLWQQQAKLHKMELPLVHKRMIARQLLSQILKISKAQSDEIS